MNFDTTNISGRECYLLLQPSAKHLLIQPVDEHDLRLLEQEVDIIWTLSSEPFSLVAFKIEDWNRELTPWVAQPVFGTVPFGDGAESTLAYIAEQLLPVIQQKGTDTSHCLLGGYSLAGLFALWAGYQTDRFEGIAAVSPSVWYPSWMAYAAERRPFAKAVYLSLGDREEKAKNPIMAQVGSAIRRQEELLQRQGVNTILEWNAGNHFVDSEKRMAKGFAWLNNQLFLEIANLQKRRGFSGQHFL